MDSPGKKTSAPESPVEQPLYAAGAVVCVAVPVPAGRGYDYRVPNGFTLAAGALVRVPLGGREAVGVVWGAGSGDVAQARLRDIAGLVDCPPMTAEMRRFVEWVADYTVSPLGAVLRMALSVPAAFDPPPTRTLYTAGGPQAGTGEAKLTQARARVLTEAREGPARAAADLARAAGVGLGVVRAMTGAGLLRTVSVADREPPQVLDTNAGRPRLSEAQSAAADGLREAVRAHAFGVHVLDGVPGSGKTEVYFDAIAETLDRDRQVLVLLPEIALGAQWLRRFRDRFGGDPLVWHSELTQKQRRMTWRAVAERRARLVVGARSALFLPFDRLGLVVIDEEHDAAYKQEEGVIYNARDMAVVRARLCAAPVVLVSATPSLETVVNVGAGRYGGLHLPDRHGGALLPHIERVDLRATPPPSGSWISPPLVERMTETLAEGEQAMLFLNRRGYAPLTLCRTCGHRLQCPRCTAWLVDHRLAGRLQCHHCGYTAQMPRQCPSCTAEGSFAPCGPGVERLAEEVARRFPAARLAIAASDTLTGPHAAESLVGRVERREIDVLIGTQIVAKGYHFPGLTLVGVVDADLGLEGGDLRAAERTFQLLYQVAGRAGRAERPGRVLLQTYRPDHPVMAALASGERDRFIAAETEARERSAMPPFGRLIALIVSSVDERALDDGCRVLARTQPRAAELSVLGPAPAPLALLRGRHRRRFLIKGPRGRMLQPLVEAWIAAAKLPGRVRVQVDVDPLSFL